MAHYLRYVKNPLARHGFVSKERRKLIKMPSSYVSKYRCRCHAPGWLNGAHPSVEDGKVVRQICFNWTFTCCHWSVNIQIASAKLWELRRLLPWWKK